MEQSEPKLYLGIALHEPAGLVQLRSLTCARLSLVPRTEAHITVAYVGQVTDAECAELVAELSRDLDDALASFQVTGTGAACQPLASTPGVVTLEGLIASRAHGCVGWWSVAPSPALLRLRNAATALLAHMGRPVPRDEPFCPHVTLGSRGNAEIADEDFDIFTVEKLPTLPGFACPDRVHAARLHLTASKLLPSSVACLRSW